MVQWAQCFQHIIRSLFIVMVGSAGCLLSADPVLAKDIEDKISTDIRFQEVISKARQLAASSFQAPGKDIPQSLKDIGYDEWRGIRFRPSKSLWAGTPFTVQFFHLGFLYQSPVVVHEIDKKGARRVPFSSDLFDHAKEVKVERLEKDLGFAGFRIHYPLNTPKYADELVAFLGASYFRALGKDLLYGMSARGLAINTAEDIGEEFPLFREFWIARPHPGSKEITIYALLDSESVIGAYEFVVRPGQETFMDVKSVLFIRKQIRKLGVAPLTSMFLYGESSDLKRSGDFRPEVHDSDGLLMQTKQGEWIWHPVVDPARLLINSFSGGQPQGFGLLQRDMDFDHYQDLEARYDRRPSVWVIPKNDWGRGHVELIQIPTDSEYNDNIVSFWVPEKVFEPGEVLTYSYSLVWHDGTMKRHALGYADSTRIVREQKGAMFLIDFAGDVFKKFDAQKDLTADINISKGHTVTASQIMSNPVTGGVRLVLHVGEDKEWLLEQMLSGSRSAVELRVLLKDKSRPVTETWSYTYQP